MCTTFAALSILFFSCIGIGPASVAPAEREWQPGSGFGTGIFRRILVPIFEPPEFLCSDFRKPEYFPVFGTGTKKWPELPVFKTGTPHKSSA